MFKIGDKQFEKKTDVNETMKELRQYLSKNGIILVNEFDVPYSEDQIRELLTREDTVFKTKEVVELEKETIEESLLYIQKVNSKMQELIECDSEDEVYKWFPEIINAFLEMEKISNYFGSDVIKLEKIDSFARKALLQIEEKNEGYLREIIEYEFIPMLGDFKKFLIRGKSNC